MNFANLAGIIFAVVVMVFSMVWGNDSPGKLVDYHAMVIVIFGSIACVGVAYSLPRVGKMVMIFFRRMLRSEKPNFVQVIRDLMEVAEAYRKDSPELAQLVEKQKDPFMKEALKALTDGVLDQGSLIRVLYERADTKFEIYLKEAKMFVSMGKFPPAMGLMGAVLGMINLLGTLGQPGAEKNIGPAMAVALVATLYGIAVANLFVIPIGENFKEFAEDDKRKNTIVVEGIRHIAKKINPTVLEEELNSFLLPGERIDRKKK